MDSIYTKVVKKQSTYRLHPNTIEQIKQLAKHFNTSQAVLIENVINDLHTKIFKK
jgi:predicted DNA-binding protein